MKRILSVLLCFMILMLMIPVSVMAKNSPDAEIINNVEIIGVHTPYAGEKPDYSSRLGGVGYTYSSQMASDPEVFEGKWWYDETSRKVLSPDSTFAYGHTYTLTILLVSLEGYEFRVDNFDTPYISATVNGEDAVVYDALTSKNKAFVEYTFEPCDYNYEIDSVSVNVTEPVPGEYPDFTNIEIETEGVEKDSVDSPFCIYGVAWYDYKTQTYMNPSDPFVEDGVYEIIIFLTTVGDFYFKTEDSDAAVVPYINGKEGDVSTAGKDDKYHISISYIFGDVREVVEYVDVIDIKEPAVGSNPVFDATPVGNKFYINGVFWTDVTNTTEVSMKETDVFLAGHTYELQVWIRANEDYKFCVDDEGYIDIMALVGGTQADILLPGSEISAELSVRYTLSESTLVSFVDVMYVDMPVAGETPDMDAFCTTPGCNVSMVEWYDVTDNARGVLLNEDDTFEAGRTYLVNVTVDAEGNYTYELDDMGVNDAVGYINGQKAIVYGTYDNKQLALGYKFAPCAEDPNKPTEPEYVGISGDSNEDSKVNVKDATLIQKFAASLATLSETQLILSDVNGDEKVNVKDATVIQKFAAGMDTGYPVGKTI